MIEPTINTNNLNKGSQFNTSILNGIISDFL